MAESRYVPQDETLKKIYGMDERAMEEAGEHLMIGGGTRGGPVLHHGKGVRVWDVEGKEYIDCTSQSWALYLGYSNDEIWGAVDEHAQNLTHTHQGFDTLTRFALAKRLADVAPDGMNRVSFVPTSALAVEGSMKLALKNRPGSSHFMCLWDAWHGTTLGTMGASWISTQANGSYVGGSRFLPMTRQFVRVPNPYCYRCYFGQEPDGCNLMCAKMLELTIQKGVNGPPAGLVIEPLQASGGQICFPRKYVEAIREICDTYGIPLIFDEIQTFVRIGAWTAADYFEVTPDLIALGKAVGGGLPLGATIIRDGMEGYAPDSEEQHTFANNSLSQVGALKLIDIIERDKVLDNVNRMGERLREGLLRLQKTFPEIGDIRQAGLHLGVEFVRDPEGKEPLYDETKEIRNEAMKRGVIFGLAGVRQNLLKIKPPLIVCEQECDEVIKVLGDTLKAVLR
ncbi:MAG: aminotransferase class III-fold pyridoxal phosphate-dependent enzyme [Candidatus Latescibacteria bacterium]|jgi:4-aminobutyrate aminotransferase-like enzyme|nr:aminotransferase class III-fold pyridoxal phosphate-dependent enzyme [Candidatus Latescibacterota bacterium]